MDAVKARVRVDSVMKDMYGERVEASPVTNGKGNESYAKFTPSGKVSLTITNPAAFGFFVPGREYDVAITPRADTSA